MKKPWFFSYSFLLILTILLSACGGAANQADTQVPTTGAGGQEDPPTPVASPVVTEAATEAPTEAATQAATQAGAAGAEEDGLVSIPVDDPPTLDGAGDDEAWQNAQPIEIETSGGVNESDTTVTIQSVYTADQVFFLVTWADPTQSFLRASWEKQPDGSWVKLVDPNDEGGDNNLYYEDKISFIWSIGNSIPGFEENGCFTACHAGENSDEKPYGNKYTDEEGQVGDIWHWKSVRNVNQIDDQYLDWTRFSPDTREAGRKSDPKDTGGYTDNQTEDGSLPAFMPPNGGNKDGSPGFITDEEKVPFDDSLFQAGDLLPSVIVSEATGDRGNLSGGWVYADGTWSLEIGRDLSTGSQFDVQFEDLTGTYYFGVATFDNAQVRHAFQTGVTPFSFEQR